MSFEKNHLLNKVVIMVGARIAMTGIKTAANIRLIRAYFATRWPCPSTAPATFGVSIVTAASGMIMDRIAIVDATAKNAISALLASIAMTILPVCAFKTLLRFPM